jgi:hypothetical protein
MTIGDLVMRIHNWPEDQPFPWIEMREELHDEHIKATSETQRSAILELFRIVMDGVEKSLPPGEKLDNFREARRKDYNLFIVRECLIGEHVSTDLLDFVTKREVAAGRMQADHELRVAAEQGMAAPHHSPAELKAQHEAKTVAQSPAPAERVSRFDPSLGLLRIAAAIRWFGYLVAAIAVLIAVAGLFGSASDKWAMLLLLGLFAATSAGGGWVLAWIVEGFAGSRR